DGTGTTSLAYYPSGVLGAGQVSSSDGPLPNDTITYGYDELGRMKTRQMNGVNVTWDYDGLGRPSRQANPLGTFGYTYDGMTSRVSAVSYPNGQTTSYS